MISRDTKLDSDRFQKVKRSIYRALTLFAIMTMGNQVSAQTIQETNANIRSMAECSARATFIQLSIDAYSSQALIAKNRSEQGAVSYVIEKTANQNLNARNSEILIRKTVKYVYEVLTPPSYSPSDLIAIKDAYYKRCMFDPEGEVGDFYVVDLKKGLSKDTDGEYITQNEDGSKTVCHKGECKSQQQDPPENFGKSYEDVRSKIQGLGWSPAPSAVVPILIRLGQLSANGRKFITDEMYGNCLIENSECDKSKPELADCTKAGQCTAVWTKSGATIWYVIQNGLVAQFNSAPANFAK